MTDLKIIYQALKSVLPKSCVDRYGTCYGTAVIIECCSENDGSELDKEDKSVLFKFSKEGTYLGFE